MPIRLHGSLLSEHIVPIALENIGVATDRQLTHCLGCVIFRDANITAN